MMTVPALLAAAHGATCTGAHRCFYCAAPADGSSRAADYVLDSFTGRNDVAAPGSECVCAGCVLCLREACAVDTIDGTRGRVVTKAAMRAFSWVITRTAAIAASKAHLARLASVCLAPPEPPFAIVLSDSGKKHLLYRGVVSWSRDPATATLEGAAITYRPAALAQRLDLCGKLIAATGKPALAQPPTVRFAIAVCERYADGVFLCSEWEAVHAESLSRLAAWLSPGRDDAGERWPATTGAP